MNYFPGHTKNAIYRRWKAGYRLHAIAREYKCGPTACANPSCNSPSKECVTGIKKDQPRGTA